MKQKKKVKQLENIKKKQEILYMNILKKIIEVN